MQSLANNLRWRRKKRGYTQEQLAVLLSVHRTTYTKYENDVVDPPLEVLCLMAEVLACTTDELLGRR